jgi:ribosome maturation factor RimP
MQQHPAVIEKLTELVAPCLASMGLVLWGVELGQSGRRQVTRLYLDLAPEIPRTPQRQGVTVDECASVSRRLSALLDVEELFHGPYVLEVSSPGLGRRFFAARQLPEYVGREIEAKLIIPRDGRKRFRGLLTAVSGEQVTMTVDPGPKAFTLSFAFAEADRVRLIHAFDATCDGGTGDDGPLSGTSEETP